MAEALTEERSTFIQKLLYFGVGRRKLNDPLFNRDPPHPRLGTYDEDDEELCHEIIKSTCNIPGCIFTTDSLLDFENHYNSAHRYSCGECKKVLPSPHFLDLHLQETHDSFFAVMAERKPSYCCYMQECKEKFKNAEDRMEHCVKEHKIPKDFRYDMRPKPKKNKVKNKQKQFVESDLMDLDKEAKSFSFTNSKQKAFTKYTGKTFTKNKPNSSTKVVDMMEVVNDLRESLPES